MTQRGHEITVKPSSDHVVIRVNDTVVADSTRPVVLTETGSPDRYYLPADDVRMDLLSSTTTTSHCPFKGDAVYWSVTTDGGVTKDVVWSYPTPLPAVQEIKDLIAFWPEQAGVTLEVNG
jgi:uncharacterized protein (DUF427 family)